MDFGLMLSGFDKLFKPKIERHKTINLVFGMLSNTSKRLNEEYKNFIFLDKENNKTVKINKEVIRKNKPKNEPIIYNREK